MSCCGGGHTGNSARFWGGDEAWHLISEASSTTAALLHHRPLLSQYPTYLSFFSICHCSQSTSNFVYLHIHFRFYCFLEPSLSLALGFQYLPSCLAPRVRTGRSSKRTTQTMKNQRRRLHPLQTREFPACVDSIHTKRDGNNLLTPITVTSQYSRLTAPHLTRMR